jgi:hypothetical protein
VPNRCLNVVKPQLDLFVRRPALELLEAGGEFDRLRTHPLFLNLEQLAYLGYPFFGNR